MMTDTEKKRIIDNTMSNYKKSDKLILAAESFAEMAHMINEYMTGRLKLEGVAKELAYVNVVVDELKVIFGRALVDKFLEERYLELRTELSVKAFMIYKKLRDLYMKINEMYECVPDNLTWQLLRERLDDTKKQLYDKIIDPEHLEIRDYHRFKDQLQVILETHVFYNETLEFEWQRNIRSILSEII